jgi:RND family efflux transporter MFP subunit
VLVAAGTTWWLQRAGVPAVQTVTVRLPPAVVPDTAVLDATGYVTARRQATVSAKVTGRVTEVLIEEGQAVAADDVLARLDAADAAADVALAHAQVAAAEALLADLRVQLAQADRDLARQRELLARRLASPQAAEDARTQVDSLTARLASQQRQIAVARRTEDAARVQLDNTIVRAPFAGIVTVKAAQPGEIVSPISAGGGFTRTGIGTIVDMDSLEIEVDVNEAYISRVRSGQPVEAVLNAYPDLRLPARVITVIPAADRSKATVRVRIAIGVKDPRIVPDMGVRVSFLEPTAATPRAAAPAGLLVPETAIASRSDANFVFVVAQDRVQRRQVMLGQASGQERQVLAGLAAGERVVLAPPAGLADGAVVRIAEDR